VEVDKEVSPPILKREMEEEQKDGLLWVTGELGSPAIKNPPDTWSPEGAAGEQGAGQDPEAHHHHVGCVPGASIYGGP
jgi:hypothetical protein